MEQACWAKINVPYVKTGNRYKNDKTKEKF